MATADTLVSEHETEARLMQAGCTTKQHPLSHRMRCTLNACSRAQVENSALPHQIRGNSETRV